MLNKTFLLLLLFSLSISAQNTAELIGTVTDKVTHQPLIGADVYIKELNKGVSTDARGQYRLTHLPEGNYTVWFSFLGYQTFGKKISVKGQMRSDVSLKEQAEEISGVTVSGKSIAHQKKEQSMPVTVIDMSNLRGTVSSVQDILLKTVGITLRSSGGVGSSSRISVRGLEGKRIGFFIDELPLGEQTDYIDINDIPIDMIDRIEIYKESYLHASGAHRLEELSISLFANTPINMPTSVMDMRVTTPIRHKGYSNATSNSADWYSVSVGAILHRIITTLSILLFKKDYASPATTISTASSSLAGASKQRNGGSTK